MIKDWKTEIIELIKEIIETKELYENAVYLAENKDKNGKTNTYSICLWEKDYPDIKDDNCIPERNMVIVNIKFPALKSRPSALKLSTMNLKVEMPSDMNQVENTSPYWIIEKDSKELINYLRRLIEDAIERYSGKADAFGCCSKYRECSNAMKCLHTNKLYSKSCMYRKNLESGNVFF